MAPEQIKGEPVGPATDIYALGIVIYQLVTGQVPFQGDTPLAVALQHLQETPSSPRLLRATLPAPIEVVILRSLAKDPMDRFASAGEVARAFQNGLEVMQATQASQSTQQAWPFSTNYHLPQPVSAVASSGADEVHEPPPPDEMVGISVGAYRIDRALWVEMEHESYSVRREEKSYRLHLWRAPRDLPSDEQVAHLKRVRERVDALAALDVENVLPVVDRGDFQGLPYLVTTELPGPSLTDLLGQRGPLSPVTASLYLDQVSAALEAAHERGILHLNLTTDCISISDLGGNERAVVDFAPGQVKRGSAGASPLPSRRMAGDAFPPEQILGNPEGTYTDVYALGSVLFQMLTARPVFTGATRDDIARQHLHTSVPPVRELRAELPVGSDYVVARALAKAPAQRFAHPRELAAAYRRLIGKASGAPAFVMAHPLASQGTATIPLEPAGANTASRTSLAGLQPTETGVKDATYQASGDGTAPPPVATQRYVDEPRDEQRRVAPQGVSTVQLPPVRPRGFLRNRLFTEIASVVALLAILGGTFIWLSRYHASASTPRSTPVVTAPPVTGTARFFDTANSQGAADGLIVDTTNLSAPPAGHVYMAWLVDDASEHIVPLGALTQGDTGFTLTYSPGAGASKPNLIAFGNHLEITLEQGTVPAPAGKVVLSGVFPPQALAHVKHLLVAFPSTPGQRGFLVGLVQQATILEQQAQVLQSFIQRQYFVSAPCAAQNVVNLLEGTHGQHYHALGPECAARNIAAVGDGYGILGTDGYLAGVSDHASLAANAPDATPHTHMHAQHIEIAVTNVTGWLTTADQDVVSVLGGNHDPNIAQEIVTLVGHAVHGVDTNGDESIDPVIGEAGVATAYSHGQLLASIDLSASNP